MKNSISVLSISIVLSVIVGGMSAEAAPNKKAVKAQPAPVQQNEVARDSRNYGMAGCGLGALIFKENDKTQILAATTNGTFANQTFGMTFGTLNCDQSGKLVKKEEVKNFVAGNQRALQNDIARGQGEALDGLTELMASGKAVDKASFQADLQAKYSVIYSSNDLTADQITDHLFSVIQ